MNLLWFLLKVIISGIPSNIWVGIGRMKSKKNLFSLAPLHNEGCSLPGQKFKKYYKKETVGIINKNAEVTFNNLPQDLYA